MIGRGYDFSTTAQKVIHTAIRIAMRSGQKTFNVESILLGIFRYPGRVASRAFKLLEIHTREDVLCCDDAGSLEYGEARRKALRPDPCADIVLRNAVAEMIRRRKYKIRRAIASKFSRRAV